MRIGYVATEDFTQSTGVTKKIGEQCDAWRAAGFEVALNPGSPPAPCEARRGIRWLRHVDTTFRHAGEAAVDAYYVRFSTWVPGLSALAKRAPVILEFNGDDLAELASRRIPYRTYHRTTRSRALSAASGIVVPSQELQGRPHFRAQSSIIISNGISLADRPPEPVPGNDCPVLGFTYTSHGPWTGVEDVVEMAAALPEFRFLIVGPRPKRQLPANVVAPGYLRGNRFDAAMSQIDVGIGSLALHRAGLTEASTLKVRGYLAAGIPAIIGHRDSDFPSGAPFLLEVPNQPRGILERLDDVQAFVAKWWGRRVDRAAITHLDSAVKEQERLAFILHHAAVGQTS